MEPIVAEDTQSASDPQRNQLAQARVERNRWFAVVLVQALVILLTIGALMYAFKVAQTTKEIVYVKLEPNGAWSVVDYKPTDPQLYFKTTIDSLLERFAITRYSANPETIESDWGEASVFLSPTLATEFIDKNGFDALGKMVQIKKTGNRSEITITRPVEHYDEINWTQANQVVSKVVKSNIYLDRKMTVGGYPRPVEHLVLSVQWRLMPKSELVKKDKDVIRLNPIGLEIVSYQLKKERSNE